MKTSRRAWLIGVGSLVGCRLTSDFDEVPGRWLRAGGQTWRVRDDVAPADPGLNRWRSDRRAVQAEGNRLRLTAHTDRRGPFGAELWVPLPANARVSMTVDAGDGLHPEDVLGLFLFRNAACEVDIEIARWGNPDAPDTWHTTPGAESRTADLGADCGRSDHTITVSDDAIVLESSTLAGSLRTVSRVPRCVGIEHVLHLNLWRRDRVVRPDTTVELTVELTV